MRRMKQKWQKTGLAAQLLIALLVPMLLTGCGARSSAEATIVSNSGGGYKTAADTAMTEELAVVEDSGVETAEITAEITDPGTGRKLIKEVSLEVETEEYSALSQALTEQITKLGGYVQSFYTAGNENSGDSRYGQIQARIPKERLDEFIKTVEGASNVTYRQETVTDVTLQYVDLESRKNALLTEQQRLLELMEQAETVEDLISIESRLSEVRYQLESMESQLRTFDNQIDYSTVYINITEVIRLTPATGSKMSAWERIRTGFAENVYAVGVGISEFCIGFLISLPILFVVLVTVLILLAIVMLVRRIGKKRRAKKLALLSAQQTETQIQHRDGEENGKQL